MLSEDEKRFMAYWEQYRDREKKLFRQWLVGLPAAVVFGVAIAINFSSGWYKRATYIANSRFNPMILVVAVVIIVTFMAIFTKRHKWEMNEQRYLEFKARQEGDNKEQEDAAKNDD